MTQISASDIKIRYSEKLGPTGYSRAGTKDGSLGGFISYTEVSATPLNNLFNDLSGADNEASVIHYRCIFIHNQTSTGNTAQGVLVYISGQASNGANIEIAKDLLGVTAIGGTNQAQSIANETTAPIGLTFKNEENCNSVAEALSLGDISPGYCAAIWVKRMGMNTTALNNDDVHLTIICGTAA